MEVKPSKTEEIYYAVLDKGSDTERSVYLDDACAHDSALRSRVEALLRANEDAGSFLKASLVNPNVSLDMTETDDILGTTIGHYILREKIGEGGMAVVYRAEQQQPIQRTVALKLIKLGMDTKSVIARFAAERQALALMDHPNIARVFEAGATDAGRPYFVMEWVQGISITEYCDKNKLNTQQRLELFIPICNAVHHAHQKGIIHRDLKPSNIMVTLQDSIPTPKVIDFGIAKATDRHLTEKTLFTHHAQIIGTPEYMSPEQAELSNGDVDTRTDIYSLGIILYELLTGVLPFDADTLRAAALSEIHRIIREQEPLRPSTRLSALGEKAKVIAQQRDTEPGALLRRLKGELEWIPLKAMRKDRARRYTSAAEFAVDIRNYLRSAPLIAGPESRFYVTRKWAKRHRALVTFVSTVAATILIGLVTSIGLYIRAEGARQREALARAEAQAAIDFLTQDLLGAVYPERVNKQEVTVSYLLDNASQNLEQKLSGTPRVEALIHETMGSTYGKMGKFEAAELHLKRAFEIRLEQHGERHLATLTAMDQLGSLYISRTQFDKAFPLLSKALDGRKELLGEAHPDTLKSMLSLATRCVCKVDYSQGVELIAEVIDIGKREMGEDDPLVLEAMLCLAGTYRMGSQYEQAERLALEGYALCCRNLGEDHSLTLQFTAALCWIYTGMSRQNEARQIALPALETSRKVLGEDHPITISLMYHLGEAYLALWQHDKAAPLLTRSVELATRVLGEESAMTVLYASTLAVLYDRQKRHKEHEDLLIRLIEISRRTLRKDHPQTVFISHRLMRRAHELGTLGQEQCASGDYGAAVESLVRSRELREIIQGKPTPWDRANGVVALKNCGREQEARVWLEELRAMYEHGEHADEAKALYLAEQALLSADTETYRAWELINDGELAKALIIVERLQDPSGSDIDLEPPDVLSLKMALARTYGRQAAIDEVQREYNRAEKSYITAVRVCPNYALCLRKLACFRATSPDEEMRNGIQAVHLATQACELTQWENAECMETLAAGHAEIGDFDAAGKWQERAIDILADDVSQGRQQAAEKRLDLYESRQPLRPNNTRSLVAKWDFQEVVDGQVMDASGNGLHGRLAGKADVVLDEEWGNVLQFYGNSGQVNCGVHPAFDITGPITIAAWIKAQEAVTSFQPIVSKGQAGWRLLKSQESNAIQTGTWGRDIACTDMPELTSTRTIVNGQWHHIVGVFSGTELSLYIDGELDAITETEGLLTVNASPLLIGAVHEVWNQPWVGAIDDVAVYNYALSDTEIHELYTSRERSHAK